MSLKTLLQLDRLTEVLDIGANPIDGDPPYKKMLAAGMCRVTGFEPQPDALSKLLQAKSELERYYPYAVGDGSRAVLHRCRYPGWSGLYRPDPAALDVFPAFKPAATVIDEIPLSVRPLDQIDEVEAVDFLKIDVQGAELACLQSGTRKLSSCVAIQLEVSFVTLYEGQPGFGDLDVLLRSWGLIPHCFAALKRHPISPLVFNNDPWMPLNQLLEADVVYVRDFIHPERMSADQLKHLAMVAHHCYQSFDLAGRCISILTSRGELGLGVLDQYVALISKESIQPT